MAGTLGEEIAKIESSLKQSRLATYDTLRGQLYVIEGFGEAFALAESLSTTQYSHPYRIGSAKIDHSEVE